MPTKTRAELEAEIKSLKAELENKSKEEKFDEAAQDIHTLYSSYIKAGFTEEQAWELLTLTINPNTTKNKLH